jgi:hypothetical protein
MADVHGTAVMALLSPRLLEDPPKRFKGTDVSVLPLGTPYRGEEFFHMEDDFDAFMESVMGEDVEAP